MPHPDIPCVILRRHASWRLARRATPHQRTVVRHRIFCHIVWRTRGNAEVIDAGLARFLCRFLRAVARRERARVLEIGLVADHVHMLVRLHPLTGVSRLMQRCKGGSSYLAGRERTAAPGGTLRWAKGYSIESVSPRALSSARAYIRQQPSRHPDRAIPGWEGDVPHYDAAGREEWMGPGRFRVCGRAHGSPTTTEPDTHHRFTG